eukprot:gene9381-1592_t
MSKLQRYETLISSFSLKKNFEPIKTIYESKKLDEILEAFPKNLVEKLWKTVLNTINVILETRLFLEEHENISKEEKKIADQQMVFLRQITSLLQSFLKYNKTIPSNDLYQILKELHDLIFELGNTSTGTILQENIATLCETVYLRFPDDENSHELIPQSLPYLLTNSLQKNSKKSDVKRIYNLKSGLNLLDLEEENVIQELLLRCVISPFYLNLSEGKKFIQFVFTLNLTLVKLVHSTIISQIPSAKVSILETYGDFYFKSWKNSTGKTLIALEYDCIQDLMYHAIHSRDFTLFKNIRVILDSFYLNKKQNGVDELLLRLYEPILFRSLNVANDDVRKNSAAILTDAFPFRNPDQNKEESEQLIQKQFKFLQDLLKDESPKVRVVAVEGVCKILGIYWEIIPTENTYQFLKTLILDMANDSNSPLVRQSVFKGLSFLLDSHLAQPTLKNLLKKLSNSIHDVSKMVRISFLDLLLKVKSIRSIKYYDIVEVDDILMRLAVDDDKRIIEKISELLLNSFLPFEKSVSIQVSRLLDFIERNSIAAKKFYQSVSKFAPLASVSKLIHVINKYLKKVIDAKKIKKKTKNDSLNIDSSSSDIIDKKKRKLSKKMVDSSTETSSNESSIDSHEKYYKASQNISLIENLVEIQFLLFESTLNSIRKVEEEKLFESTIDHFTGELLNDIVVNFKTPKISCFIWGIAKNLPKENIEIISQNSLNRLELMCEEGILKNDYKFILDCVMHWKLESKLMDIIETYMTWTNESPTGKKMNGKKKQRIEKASSITPENSIIVLHFINYLLSNEDSRNFILKSEKIATIMTDLMEEIGDYLERDKFDDEFYEKYLTEAFYLYPKYIIHLVYFKEKKRSHNQDSKIFEATPIEIMELLDFYSDSILPALYQAGLNGQLKKVDRKELKRIRSSSQNDDSNDDQIKMTSKPSFGLDIAKTMLIFISEMISLGLIKSSQSKEISTKITEILIGFMQNELKNILPNLFSNFLKIVYQWSFAENEVGTMMFTLNDIFYFFCDNLKEEEMKYIHELITECMSNEVSKVGLTKEMIKKYLIEKDEEDQAFSELIIQICIKNKEFLKGVLNELFDDFETSKERIIQFLSTIINQYHNEFKDSMNQIKEKLTKFEYDENILKLKNSIQVL